MKLAKITIILLYIYILCGIPYLFASSIEPSINRVALPQGQIKYGTVIYNNSEDIDIQISISPYAYNPQTDELSDDGKDIFLKVDTDTITVKAKTSFEIKYEIYPLSNLQEGSYFNILVLTPLIQNKDVEINASIAQLVILDIVDAEDEVKGITTTRYTTNIQVLKKGIPFLTPLKIKYTITNNSNYLLTPQGRIDLFNEQNKYKPVYEYINKEKENIYPKESLTKEVTFNHWHITDLYIKRVIMGEIYNGIDNEPQYVEIEINSYLLELSIISIIGISGILLTKYLKEAKKRKKLKHT